MEIWHKICLIVRKSFIWIKGYVHWKRKQLQRILRKHIDWYDSKVTIEDAKRLWNLNKKRCFKDISGIREFCVREGIRYQTIKEKEISYVVSPEYFEGDARVISTYECPSIYIAQLQRVSVYGYSELITVGKTALSDAYMMDKDQGRYKIDGGSLVKCRNGKYILAVYRESNLVIDKAISMLGWCADNYYHFTFEIISRLVFADQFEEYRTWPILIDQCVLEIVQLRDLLDSMNIYRHPIISVKARERVEIKNLLYVSYNMWMPHNFRENVKQYPSDYLFSTTVVLNIRNYVYRRLQPQCGGIGTKIFLSRRKCKNQRLLNAEEVERCFKENGFGIVYPEELSFEEEVRVFQRAEVIVGPTGAALTNVVYCKEGTLIAVIAPLSHKSYFFSNIAYMVGAKFMLLGADMVFKGMAESMDTFCLDMDKCRRFLNRLK